MSRPPLRPAAPAPGPRLETQTVASGAMVSAYGQRVQVGVSVRPGNVLSTGARVSAERSTIAISSAPQVL